jgi:hypothetical protein
MFQVLEQRPLVPVAGEQWVFLGTLVFQTLEELLHLV